MANCVRMGPPGIMRALAVTLILALCACQRGSAPSSAEPRPPDLVLLLVQGLRADAPGEPGAEAAFLAALPPKKLVFTAAYAQSPSPFQSLGSLLTGRYPSAIPICGAISDDPAQPQPWCHALPAERATLPGVLGLYGYRTALVNSHLPDADQLAADFQHVEDLGQESWRTPWEPLEQRVRAWWDQEPHEPRLLVVVLADLMVQQRPELRVAMGLPARPGPQEAPLPDPSVLPDREELLADQDPTSVAARLIADPSAPRRGPQGRSRPHTGPQGAARDRVLSVYGAAAAEVGAGFARLLEGLAPAPGRERWIALSSTNGINLGESSGSMSYPRAFAFHELVLERTVHVPLALLGPRALGLVRQPVELTDILPSLLARSPATPPHGLPGQDLLCPDFEPAAQASAYAEFGDMLALRQGRHLLTLRAMFHNSASLDPDLTRMLLIDNIARRYLLHDVLADPLQMVNLVTADEVRARELRQELIRLRTGPGAPPAALTDSARFHDLRLTASEGYW